MKPCSLSAFLRNRQKFLRTLLFLLPSLFILLNHSKIHASQVHLSWVDSANNEDGFTVERKIGTNGTFTQIATVGANVTTYVDASLELGVTYCYRVRAFNQVEYSEYSNEACLLTPTLVTTVESPEGGQSVSGIDVIRGWTFDTQVGNQIESVEVLIDGKHFDDIPCCSQRNDVLNAFPQFPAQNTQNSGWGSVINWGLFNAGLHTLQVQVRSTAGAVISTATRLVTVVKPGDFEFLERFDLSDATASISGDRLLVDNVLVQDKATQQQKRINVGFHWFVSSQSLRMVDARTVAEVTSLQSLWPRRLVSSIARFLRFSTTSKVHADPGVIGFFESPEEGQVVSGIGVLRGWAFPEEAPFSLAEISLLIDGVQRAFIPCCSSRGDVAQMHPALPQALNSGWGLTVNYGELDRGFHLLEVQIKGSQGMLHTLGRGVTVEQLGGYVFLDQFDLTGATAMTVGGEQILLQGVRMRDKTSQQTGLYTVILQWFPSAQKLGIIASMLMSE